jgi:hypothetical protein
MNCLVAYSIGYILRNEDSGSIDMGGLDSLFDRGKNRLAQMLGSSLLGICTADDVCAYAMSGFRSSITKAKAVFTIVNGLRGVEAGN